MSDHYYIPPDEQNRIAVMGELLACTKCGRKILVQMGLIGTVHHLGTAVVCAECLEIEEDFRQKHPDITKQLEDWKLHG